MKGFVDNIESLTLNNENFRKVIYTAKNSQLVVMSLKPNEDIGLEVHNDTDQFLRFESGQGTIAMDGKILTVSDGDAIVVPAGVRHNVTNTSTKAPLKLYTVYSPAHHRDGTVHITKADAERDSAEHFDGSTTEQTVNGESNFV